MPDVSGPGQGSETPDQGPHPWKPASLGPDGSSAPETRVAIVSSTEHGAEAAFGFVATREVRSSAGQLEGRAAFLARVTGEAGGPEDALLRLVLTYGVDPGSSIEVQLEGYVPGPDPEKARHASERRQAEVAAALSDLAPTRWRSLTIPKAHRTALDGQVTIARLCLAPATDAGPDVIVYPLRASTLERALRVATTSTTVVLEFLVFPRRRLPPGELRHDLYTRSSVSVATEADARTGRVSHVDPADRWHFAARIEVRCEGPVPTALLAAIAADIRGTGEESIGTLLAGRAAPVDAEWEIVPAAADAGSGGFDDGAWPRWVPRLNLREAACLLALPSGDPATAGVPDEYRHVPKAVPTTGLVLGTAEDGARPVGVSETDRARHLYICGRTGCGKTTLLTNLVAQDLQDRNRLVVVFDPHGAFGEQVAGLVPAWRIDQVVYIDPSEMVAPVGFNPIWVERPEDIVPRLDLQVAVLEELHEPYHTNQIFGPIAKRAWRAMLATVMSITGSTYVDAMELLADPGLWRKYAPHVRLKWVHTYWEQWLKTSSKEDAEQMPYLASKISPLVDDLAVRRIIDQPRSTFSFDDLLVTGGVVIVPLGSTGSVAASLLTRILLHDLLRAAKQRGQVGPDAMGISLYIDEVQLLSGPVLEGLYSGARKWRMSCCVANQHASQLPETLVHAIAGNVGTIVSYGVSVHDSPVVARMLGGDASLAAALPRLPNYRAVVGSSPNGEPQPPFLMESPAPLQGFSVERLEAVKAASRRTYGGTIRDAERSSAVDEDAEGSEMPGAHRLD